MKIKNKHQLKQRDIKELITHIHRTLNVIHPVEGTTVEIGTVDDGELIFINGTPLYCRRNGTVFFTLVGLLKVQPHARFVVVDAGAIRFIANGADVMAPGIVDADEWIQLDDIVWVCDEQYKKPLAVGTALMTGPEMKLATTGKAVKLIHYIGDTLWNQTKEFL